MARDFTETSFADATEAAIHYALLNHYQEVKERDHVVRVEGKAVMASTADIYIKNRRLIRDIATGKKDPEEYLDEQERL